MTPRRTEVPSKPLDAAALERLALAYVGRFATSRVRLERYLRRKIAERGGDAVVLDPVALVDRLAAVGYVDDCAMAAACGRSLARRGLGPRRLAGSLDVLGISADDRAEAMSIAGRTAWDDALRFAERRRIGPFATTDGDETTRRRAMAAMLRAGHAVAIARQIVRSPPGDVPQRDE